MVVRWIFRNISFTKMFSWWSHGHCWLDKHTGKFSDWSDLLETVWGNGQPVMGAPIGICHTRSLLLPDPCRRLSGPVSRGCQVSYRCGSQRCRWWLSRHRQRSHVTSRVVHLLFQPPTPILWCQNPSAPFSLFKAALGLTGNWEVLTHNCYFLQCWLNFYILQIVADESSNSSFIFIAFIK